MASNSLRLSLAIILMAPPLFAADLTIDVTGVKSTAGQVIVAAYDRPASFLTKPYAVGVVKAAVGKVTALIDKLPPGDYAISVFQDENGNHKLDTNSAGMPTEPYGFGNDAEGDYGPPSFQQAIVHVPVDGNHITIALHSLGHGSRSPGGPVVAMALSD